MRFDVLFLQWKCPFVDSVHCETMFAGKALKFCLHRIFQKYAEGGRVKQQTGVYFKQLNFQAES